MPFGEMFSCRTQWVVPSRQDSSILPAQPAYHSAEFDLSCLLMCADISIMKLLPLYEISYLLSEDSTRLKAIFFLLL